jgi:glycosyltransferase involved in cell wall biosynthesis
VKVSIITICYNSQATIEETIQSVLNQDYPDLEYIIIDGASKDNTLQIIDHYRESISTVISEKDKGIYDAMNKGIQHASGEVIGILNSDDTFADNHVVSDLIQQLASADAVYADLNYVHPVSKKVVRHWKSGNYSPGKFLLGWMPPHPTFFVRKEVYSKYGGFIIDHGSAADYEIMLRFIHKYNITLNYLPRVVTLMKTGGASNVTWKQRWKANQQDRQAWIKNNLKPKWYTLWLKPIRKLKQFLG